jgi:hypothetical protein
MNTALSRVGIVFTSILWLCGTLHGEGGSYSWDPPGQNEDWTEAGSWDPDRTDPQADDWMHLWKVQGANCIVDLSGLEDPQQEVRVVLIENANTVEHTAGHLKVLRGAAPEEGYLTVGGLGGTGSYAITGGDLTATECVVGSDSEGAFSQDGEDITCTFGTLRVGKYVYNWQNSETSTYTLSAGTLQVIGSEFIGHLTRGEFLQEGGEHNVAGSLYLGMPFGKGYYEMTGGTLKVGGETGSGGSLVVGTQNGHFLQGGGTAVEVVMNDDEEGGLVNVLGDGDYTIEGTFTGPALSAASMEITGSVTVGSEETPTDAKIELAGTAFQVPSTQLFVSLFFENRSKLLVYPPDDIGCTFLLTGAKAAVRIAQQENYAERLWLSGLAASRITFEGKDPTETKKMELPDADFGKDGFENALYILGELVVGKSDADPYYGPVKLQLLDEVDNDGEGFEAPEFLYVNKLTIKSGGTFLEDDFVSNLYYLNGGSGKCFYMGDANLDGQVDFTDYQILERNFGTTPGAEWDMGDFNGDRAVNFTDYLILERNFGKGGEGRRGEGAERLDADGRALPVLKHYDGDGDVDIDDLHLLQAMKEEEQP